MSISDYLMQIPLKKANPTADALDAYAAAQAPQVPQMQANTSRTISEALFRRGGLLTDIAGMAFGAKADKIDAQNAQKLQQYGAEKSMYDTLLNWNRQDQLAQNKSADALDQYAREREAEQRKWAREDEVAQRNRDWSLADRQALWGREDKVAQRNRDWNLSDLNAKNQREDQQRYFDFMAPLAAKNLTSEEAQQWAKNPDDVVKSSNWLGRKLGARGNLLPNVTRTFGKPADGEAIAIDPLGLIKVYK